MNKNRKVIFLDMDDTISELLVEWVDWLNKKHNLSVNLEDITEWDMQKTFTTLTYEQIYEPMLEGYKDFWENIKPVNDAQYYVKKLQEKFDVYVVSATHYKNVLPKVEYVMHRLFPDIPDDNIIFLHNKQLLNGFVMVDDNHNNLINGNYHKILINKPYNKNSSGDFIRVNTWEEIYNNIIKLDNEVTNEY